MSTCDTTSWPDVVGLLIVLSFVTFVLYGLYKLIKMGRL